MLLQILDVIGILFMWVGVTFSALGVLGLIRLPDVYSRLHASSKVATLGLIGLLIGAGFVMPETAFRVIALGTFMVITAPMASHVIATAAHQTGVPMVNPTRDDLRDHDPDIETSTEQAISTMYFPRENKS